MAMPKSFIKGFLLVLVVALIGLVPKNTQLLFGYDTSGQFHKTGCENTAPLKVVFYEPNHPLLPKTTASGEVILNWLKLKENVDKYAVAYGLQSGNYIYGLDNVGDVNSFTVRYLTPGTKYYFAVRAANGCMPGPWSQEWSAVAPGGGSNVAILTGTTGIAGGTLPRNTGTRLTSPKPSVNPSVKPSTVPGTGGNQTGGTPPLNFWQRIGQWFSGLFK
ncbi:MAG: fibronectin type III domain-containing protein [Candidatus Beckwithbacteria bacterium]